jgi:hypothetical protein
LHINISLVAGDVGKPVSSLTKVNNQKRQVKQWSIYKSKQNKAEEKNIMILLAAHMPLMQVHLEHNRTENNYTSLAKFLSVT